MKLRYLLLASMIVILLAACAGPEAETSTTSSADSVETPEAMIEEEHADEDHADEEHADEEHADEEEHDHEDHEDEGEHRELGAHEHGAAQLTIAWTGNDAAIDLTTPAYNILGFEYTPQSDEEKALLEESVAVLEAGELLLFNADAGCTVVSASVQTAFEEAHSDEEHAHEDHASEEHGDEDHADEEHADEDHAHDEGEEHSAVEHACKHLEEGPEVAVSAVADIASTTAVTGTHVRLDVTLADAEGYFAYTAEEAGEYVFYANSIVELTLQHTDGETIQPESIMEADALVDCAGFAMAFTFDLAEGDNILAIASTDAENNLVSLVVEHASAEHEHDDHGHGDEEGHDDHGDHDHEDHGDDVHSDIDVAYNLTCETPENIASLDASALFAQFPNFEEIQVQWVSDTQQSAGNLTPDNPAIELE